LRFPESKAEEKLVKISQRQILSNHTTICVGGQTPAGLIHPGKHRFSSA